MSDNTPIIESVPEDQQEQGALLDDDLHEELWAEIDRRIARATNASYLQLARVVSAAGGVVQVQFYSGTMPHGVGFAHTMGYQYQTDQRVVVAPTEGGDFVVIGAITSTQGPHERVVTNADLANEAVDERAVKSQGLTWRSIAPASLTLDRLVAAVQAAIGLALTSIQPGHVKGNPNNADDRILTQKTGIEPGDVKGGKPGNANKIVTESDISNFLKDPGGGDDAYVQKKNLSDYVKSNQLSDYVKSNQLAKGATGSKELADKEWVKANFQKKGGTS